MIVICCTIPNPKIFFQSTYMWLSFLSDQKPPFFFGVVLQLGSLLFMTQTSFFVCSFINWVKFFYELNLSFFGCFNKLGLL
jgi:hypothetical protein